MDKTQKLKEVLSDLINLQEWFRVITSSPNRLDYAIKDLKEVLNSMEETTAVQIREGLSK